MLVWVEIWSHCVPVALHILGLFLLYKCQRSYADNSSQFYFLTCLSASEVVFLLVGVIQKLVALNLGADSSAAFWILAVQYVNLTWPIYMTMILMTFDRFFQVFLNIKYPLYWNPLYTKRLLIGTWLVAFIMSLPVFLCITPQNLEYFCFVYYYSFMEIFFFVESLCVYGYIFRKIKHNHVRPAPTSKTIDESSQTAIGNTNLASKPKHGGFYVPGFIVLSFFIFLTVPDQIFMYATIYEIEVSEAVETYVYCSYMVGLSCDAVVYIFLTPFMRKRLKQMFCC